MTHARTMIVAAGVVIEGGRVLLTQRKPGAHLGGAWELPGGKVEDGEDPRAALQRELNEELGIDVVVGEIVDVTFHRYEEAGKNRSEPSSESVEVSEGQANPLAWPARNILLLFFEATRTGGSPDPRPLDVAGIEWAGPRELDPARFPAGDLAVVAKIRGRLERPG